MRNMLESGGKAILVMKVAKNLVALCLCSSVLWKIEFASNESGYFSRKDF